MTVSAASPSRSAKTSIPVTPRWQRPSLNLRHDVAGTHEDDVKTRLTRDHRLVLTVPGALHAIPGGFENVDDPLVKMPLGGERDSDRVDFGFVSRGHDAPSDSADFLTSQLQ